MHSRLVAHGRNKTRIVPASENSPAGLLTSAFARARSDIAFDDEPQVKGATEALRSLHIVVSVGGQ